MIYRVTITYTLYYPKSEDTYTETERIYKEDFIETLKVFEESKNLENATKVEIDKIERLEEWKDECIREANERTSGTKSTKEPI